MKIERLFQALISCLLLIFAQAASAQDEAAAAAQEQERPRYRLELVLIEDSDSDRRDYIFLIGSIGFRTVEGLKSFVARMPAGSLLEWSPGCLRWGNEPLLSSTEEMEDFRRFCAEHGVEFIIHPSG
jgi:hypothetical protein